MTTLSDTRTSFPSVHQPITSSQLARKEGKDLHEKINQVNSYIQSTESIRRLAQSLEELNKRLQEELKVRRPIASEASTEYRPISSSRKQLRPFGLCAGEFTVPDDFDAPLPEDIMRAFEGE